MSDIHSMAAILHGRQCPFELTAQETRDAKAARLVIVCGASDDICEFYGAFRDESGCFNGGAIHLDASGPSRAPDDNEREVLERFGVLDAAIASLAKFEAVWGGKSEDGRGCSWSYRVPFPHAKFDVMEDDELYCVGFVFRLEDALKGKEAS